MSSTGNALAVREPAGALAIQDGQVEWDPMQLAALAQLGIADAPDGDKQVFLHVSQRTGLDPFARQIYMLERKEKKNERVNGQWVEKWTSKWTIQTGIEGWRVIRDRAERRYGVRGIKGRFIYYAPDGSEHKVWVRREPPVAVEMTYTVVEAGGREVPYTSVLRFSEYVQTKTVKVNGEDQAVPVAQWATKPTHMIEKCCEADAYRCAFPQDYSGVVLDDAMPPATAADWEAMPDEELDARAAAVGYRPRVTGDMARERAQQARQQPPQHVTATVVDPAGEELPPPPDAPYGERPPAAAPARRQQDGDPRNGILRQFLRLDVTGTPGVNGYIARLTGYAGLEQLPGDEVTLLIAILAGCQSRDELEAAAVAAEAKREASSGE